MVDCMAAVTELGRYPLEAVPPPVFPEDLPDQAHYLLVLDVLVGFPELEVVGGPREGGRLEQPGKRPSLMDGQQLPDYFRFFALASAASLLETKASSFLGTRSPSPGIRSFRGGA